MRLTRGIGLQLMGIGVGLLWSGNATAAYISGVLVGAGLVILWGNHP